MYFIFNSSRELVVTKLVILVILPSTSVILILWEAKVAQLIILDISPLTSFIVALRLVLVPKLVTSGIPSSVFFILFLFLSFTTPLSLLKSTGTGNNLSISNLSTLDFKLAKSTFLVKDDVSSHVAFFNFLNLFLLHN